MGVSYQKIVELAEEVNAIVPGVVDTRNIVPTGKILKAPEQRALKSKRRELERGSLGRTKKNQSATLTQNAANHNKEREIQDGQPIR